MTTTPTAPVYNHREHGGHNRTDARYTDVAHDVIRTTFGEGRRTTIEVVATHADYMTALDHARTFRGEPDHYGYTAPRYACGCRWVAVIIEDGKVDFIDHVATEAA